MLTHMTICTNRILLIAALFCLSPACKPKNEAKPSAAPQVERETANAIYYWKTRFELGESETAFLKEHDVKRLYLKFFDVDDDKALPYDDLDRIVPVATTVFASAKPEGVEVIPTVFLTVRAARYIAHSEGGAKEAAEKIVTRVLNMADYNDLGPVQEIQLDCDWNQSTKGAFYSLCKEVGDLVHPKGITVSSTIRLHQLKQDAPPVDRGVLMLYNTGALENAVEKNSIISKRDVAKYIQNKHFDYGIPLDFAYSTYRWGLVFIDGRFKFILHQDDYSDKYIFSPQKDGSFLIRQDFEMEGHYLARGWTIRVEESPIATILEVKKLVKQAFPDVSHSNIIYHLDSKNLAKYTSDEISSIYSD